MNMCDSLVVVERGRPFRPDLDSVTEATLNQQPVATQNLKRLARAVQQAFLRKGWTVETARNATELSKETLVKLRAGDPTLRLKSIRRFAEALGDDPEHWLRLADECEDVLPSHNLSEGLLDISNLPPAARTVARMTVDLMLPRIESGLTVKEIMRQPMRGGLGLRDDLKVLSVGILGPDSVGLTGSIATYLTGLNANIINVSAHGTGNLAVVSLRVVVHNSVSADQVRIELNGLLNSHDRTDKDAGFVVQATEESPENRGPLIGVELSLHDAPGVLNAVLKVIYGEGWVPIGIEHTAPEENTDSETRCLMSLESLRYDPNSLHYDPNKFTMESVAVLLAKLKEHPFVWDVRTAFDSGW